MASITVIVVSVRYVPVLARPLTSSPVSVPFSVNVYKSTQRLWGGSQANRTVQCLQTVNRPQAPVTTVHPEPRSPQSPLTFSTFFGPFTSSCLLGMVPPSQPIPKPESETVAKTRSLGKDEKPSLPGSLAKPYLLPALLDDVHKQRAAKGAGLPRPALVHTNCLENLVRELGVASGRRAGASLECIHFRPWAALFPHPHSPCSSVSLGLRKDLRPSVVLVPRSASLTFLQTRASCAVSLRMRWTEPVFSATSHVFLIQTYKRIDVPGVVAHAF